MTNKPAQRFKEHCKKRPWWSEVDHITLHSYKNFRSLEQAETRAIWLEKPTFNVVGTQTPTWSLAGRKGTALTNANAFGNVLPDT